MALKQKVIVDFTNTNNYQIVIKDDTGLYNAYNPSGYGGNNGKPVTDIDKFVIIIRDVLTNQILLKQEQSNDYYFPDENKYINPSLERIIDGQPITISAYNYNMHLFPDSYYRIEYYVVYKQTFSGIMAETTNIITNVLDKPTILKYNSVYDEKDFYEIIHNDNLDYDQILLSSDYKEGFVINFRVADMTTTEFILSDTLIDCYNRRLAKFAKDCGCNKTKEINSLSEIKLLLWGLEEAIKKEDYSQGGEFLKYATKLCNKCCSGC